VLRRCRAALGKARGERRRVVEIGREPPAVDGHPERAAVGELADQVAPTQARRGDREPAGGKIDQPLNQVVGFGFAGAAIGVDRHRIGKGTAHLHKHLRDGINAAHRRRRRIGRAAGPVRRQIGAEIGDCRHVERQKAAVAVEREPRPSMVVATLCGTDKFLAALGDPADRAAEPSRRPQHQHPFGIEEILHAKAAADIGRGQVDARLRQMKDGIC
jgi:hypothetical protein